MEKKLKYPELEQNNYVAQVEAETAEAKKRAEQLEKQAKWDRDMALWGDMASLAAKGAAMHGGAWKINKDESAAAKGNEKLRALQKENAAQLAAYAKQEVAARDAARKERNTQKLAQYNAEVEQYKRDLEAEKSARAQANADRTFDEMKRHNEETERIQRARVQQGGGSGVNRDVYLVNDDGTKKVFKHSENANNIQAAYAELPSGFKAQKEVKLYDEDDMGKPVLRIDAEGMPVTKSVENTKPTLGEMRHAIEVYNARALKKAGTAVPAKKANPMSSGKKTNPMN